MTSPALPSPSFQDITLPGISSVGSRFAAIQTDITANQTDIAANQTDIAANQASIATTQTEVAAVEGSAATIAALRASTSATLPQAQCYVQGYAAARDGGEGAFVSIPSDTTSSDNGSTIIVDASGRRWYRHFTGPVSVLAFGAHANSANDDSTVINAALTICAAAGVPLLFDAGKTFYINAALQIPANSHLILNGTIFKQAMAVGASQFSMLVINGANVTIEGSGTVDGNKANQTITGVASGGIVSQTGFGQNVPTVWYSNIQITGITVQNTPNWPISLNGVQNSCVSRCTFLNSGSSPQFCNSKYSGFSHCVSTGITDDGLGLYGGNSNCYVDNCQVYGCLTGPFCLSDPGSSLPNVDCALTNNRVYGNTNTGVWASGLVSGGNIIQERILVKGNICDGNGSGGDGNFYFNCVSDSAIQGNISYQSGARAGIVLQGNLNRVLVADNVITGNASPNGVLLKNDPASGNTAVVISNNVICDTNNGPGIVLQCVGSSAYVSVLDNVFTGSFDIVFTDQSATKAAVFVGSQSADNSANTRIFTQTLKPEGLFTPTQGVNHSFAGSSPGSGGTITLTATTPNFLLNNSAAYAALTVSLPSSPVDGQAISLTVLSTVSAITYTNGTTSSYSPPPASMAGGTSFTLVYVASLSVWLRVDKSA
jgi:hypothetical protein